MSKEFEPIAIVGMGGLFPRCRSTEEYWRLLVGAWDGIDSVPSSHWTLEDYFSENAKSPDMTYGQKGGFLPAMAFDPLQYGIPPQILEATDSAQLFGLMAAVMALDDAGFDVKSHLAKQRVSTIIGVTGAQELVIPLGARLGHPKWRRSLVKAGLPKEQIDAIIEDIKSQYVGWQEASFPGLLGNVIAGRVANRLDMGGTNCVVDAACASSFSALHLACLELQAGLADVAISGGVDTFNDIFMYMCFSKTPALSPTGEARPYSAHADGTTLGEAAALFVLKRLSDAQASGERIYAVIKGIGTSSDGKGHAIYAPSASGQAQALQRTYARAGYSADTVELMEGHGTGTKVGDATELEGLGKVFQRSDAYTYLGSVKSQIGHTKAAAGAAGLMKASLGLFHKVYPPTCKVAELAPALAKQDSPFAINLAARPWVRSSEHPRRASVSAFGFGGSNFHVALEEYLPTKPNVDWTQAPELFVASAMHRSELSLQLAQLRNSAVSLHGLLEECALARERFNPKDSLRAYLMLDLTPLLGANTEKDKEKALGAMQGRLQQFATWLNSSVNTREDVEGDEWQGGLGAWSQAPARDSVAVLYPGQGSQYPHMLSDLALCFPEAMAIADEASSIAGEDFRESLFPKRFGPLYEQIASKEKSAAPGSHLEQVTELKGSEKAMANLTRTDRAQPALAAVESILTRVLIDRFALHPVAFAGHSFGEVTALWAAGILPDLKTCINVALGRGQAMAKAAENEDTGGLLAIKADRTAVEALLKQYQNDRGEVVAPSGTPTAMVQIASANSPEQTTVGGTLRDLTLFAEYLQRRNVISRSLNVSAAFHTSAVAGASGEFLQTLQEFDFVQPKRPCYSGVDGKVYAGEPRDLKKHLAKQLAVPFDFVRLIKQLNDDLGQDLVFCELGPKRHLTAMVQAISPASKVVSYDYYGTQQEAKPLWNLARLLGALSLRGIPLKLSAWRGADAASWFRGQALVESKIGSISITGANYQHPKAQGNDVLRDFVEKNGPLSHKPPVLSLRENMDTPVLTPVMDSGGTSLQDSKFAGSQDGRRTKEAPSQEVLSLVQQNMAFMQKLGEQTARLHEQYLAMQQETQQHLFMLFQEQMGGMLRVPKDVSAAPAPLINKDRFSSSQAQPQPLEATPLPAVNNMVTNLAKNTQSLQPDMWPELPMKAPRESSVEQISEDDALSLIKRIVAEKTGYPFQTLKNDFLFEEDLGIDSIKKVEILSEIATGLALPDEEESHRRLSQARTLLELAGACRSFASLSPPMNWDTPLPQPTTSDPGPTSEQRQQVLEIVAVKTGYSMESLKWSMSLEEDLGIDSIKKVEILSEIADTLGLAEDSPAQDRMRQALTMADLLPNSTEFYSVLSGSTVTDSAVSAGAAVSAGPGAATKLPSPDGPSPIGGQKADSLARDNKLAATVLEIISQKTGYPEASLNLGMALEEDLGIDSIKRVEIFSELAQKLGWESDHAVPSEVKTIQAIVTFCQAPLAAEVEAAKPPVPDKALSAAQRPTEAPVAAKSLSVSPAPARDAEISQETLANAMAEGNGTIPLLHLEYLPYDGDQGQSILNTAYGATFVFYGDRDPLALIVAKRFKDIGVKVVWASADNLEEVRKPELWQALLFWVPRRDLGESERKDWLAGALANMQKFMGFVAARPHSDYQPFMVGIGAMDGCFGQMDARLLEDHACELTGALAGMLKTATRELPLIPCKMIDTPYALTLEDRWVGILLSQILKSGQNELALLPDGQTRIPTLRSYLVERQPQSGLRPGELGAWREKSLIVTGGARGVTAEVAEAVAKTTGVKLVILGRAKLLTETDPWLECSGLADIKKRLIEQSSEEDLSPKTIRVQSEKIYSQWQSTKRIAALRQQGIVVDYFACDVSRHDELTKVWQQLEPMKGKIVGVIHGAGIIRDRSLIDKDYAEFREVYDVKVLALGHLMKLLAGEDLRMVMLFSSSTARYGRLGQVDYAAANEAMNKLSYLWGHLFPSAKVFSLNWGPWEGGMVNDGLARMFKKEGVGLIGIREGVNVSTDLIHLSLSEPSHSSVPGVMELVVVQSAAEAKSISKATSQPTLLASGVNHQGLKSQPHLYKNLIPISSTCRILQDHQINGRPVFPAALSLDLMATMVKRYLTQDVSSDSDGPAVELSLIKDFRILSPLSFEEAGTKDVLVTIELQATEGSEVLDGVNEQQQQFKIEIGDTNHHLYSQCLAVVLKGASKQKTRLDLKDMPKAIQHLDLTKAYAQVLFHGDSLRCLQKAGVSIGGFYGEILTAPSTTEWLNQPWSAQWSIDPAIVDGIFQLLILWTQNYGGMPCLPVEIGRLEILKPLPALKQVTVWGRVHSYKHGMVRAEAWVCDREGQVLMRLHEIKSISDPNLKKAFQNQSIGARVISGEREPPNGANTNTGSNNSSNSSP
jgi:acyl transferase domain-containing protein/acyl carrier protein/NAD(P)-dependent dehydrogenase (short-subunit alcohol dehydrogenase family)